MSSLVKKISGMEVRMNVRILIEKGKVTEPVNGLIWYKDAITWGSATIQVQKDMAGIWENVPVVKYSKDDKKYCSCLLPVRVVGSPIDTVDSCKYCGKIINDEK